MHATKTRPPTAQIFTVAFSNAALSSRLLSRSADWTKAESDVEILFLDHFFRVLSPLFVLGRLVMVKQYLNLNEAPSSLLGPLWEHYTFAAVVCAPVQETKGRLVIEHAT